MQAGWQDSSLECRDRSNLSWTPDDDVYGCSHTETDRRLEYAIRLEENMYKKNKTVSLMGLVNRMAIFYRCFYSYGHLGSQIFALKSSFQHVYCIGTEYCTIY